MEALQGIQSSAKLVAPTVALQTKQICTCIRRLAYYRATGSLCRFRACSGKTTDRLRQSIIPTRDSILLTYFLAYCYCTPSVYIYSLQAIFGYQGYGMSRFHTAKSTIPAQERTAYVGFTTAPLPFFIIVLARGSPFFLTVGDGC
jgi:hypothetical protein